MWTVQAFCDPAFHTNRKSDGAHEGDAVFNVGGVNESADILKIQSIREVPISTLEDRMRPGKGKPPLRDFDRSDVGFIKDDQSLLQLLADDNNTVRNKYRSTHQKFAEPLFFAMKTAREGKKDSKGFVTFSYPSNSLHPETYRARIIASHGPQASPFADGNNGKDLLDIENFTRNISVRTGDMVPYMIRDYGFYEGTDEYRIAPSKLVDLFPSLSPNSRFAK
jgi:hypothetical protein